MINRKSLSYIMLAIAGLLVTSCYSNPEYLLITYDMEDRSQAEVNDFLHNIETFYKVRKGNCVEEGRHSYALACSAHDRFGTDKRKRSSIRVYREDRNSSTNCAPGVFKIHFDTDLRMLWSWPKLNDSHKRLLKIAANFLFPDRVKNVTYSFGEKTYEAEEWREHFYP